MHGVVCCESAVPEWWALPTHDPPKGYFTWLHHDLLDLLVCSIVLMLSSLSRFFSLSFRKFYTHRKPFTEWVLTGFTCGLYSTRLASLPRNEVLKIALDQLDQMFGTKGEYHLESSL